MDDSAQKVLVSLRGYNPQPILMVVDLESHCIERTLTVSVANLSHVPESKVGFTGMAMMDSRRAAIALWDRVLVLDIEDGSKLDEISDPRFSDLHSIHIDEDDVIWVSNTNLDGVYTIDGGVVNAVWHAWECEELGAILNFVEDDYRRKVKEEIPYHIYHLNSVIVDSRRIICSFLGSRRRPGRLEAMWRRAFPQARWGPVFSGGYFVLKRSTGKLIRVVQGEGLHDTKRLSDGAIWSTQYFGRALVRLDLDSLSVRKIPLQVPSAQCGGFLVRGLMEVEDGFWIGHTVPRGWSNPKAVAKLRKYDRAGHWTGIEIPLPGYVGVYDIIACGREPKVDRSERDLSFGTVTSQGR